MGREKSVAGGQCCETRVTYDTSGRRKCRVNTRNCSPFWTCQGIFTILWKFAKFCIYFELFRFIVLRARAVRTRRVQYLYDFENDRCSIPCLFVRDLTFLIPIMKWSFVNSQGNDCEIDFTLVGRCELRDFLLASHNKLTRWGSFKDDGLIRVRRSRYNIVETRWTCLRSEKRLLLALLLPQSANSFLLTSRRMWRPYILFW